MQMTILDVSRSPAVRVTGKLIKEYEKGVTIDDDRGVRYYATHERIVAHGRSAAVVDAGENYLF